jgi:hypothetical protein
LERFKKGFPIIVVEVPEKERDEACLVRFKMTIDQSAIKPEQEPGAYADKPRRSG